MIEIPLWYAWACLVANGSVAVLTLALLAANQYPIERSDRTALSDVLGLLAYGGMFGVWLYWMFK